MPKPLQIYLQLIGVEPDRHIESEAGRDLSALRRNVTRIESDYSGRSIGAERNSLGLNNAVNGYEDASGNRLLDLTCPWCMDTAVGLHQLKRCRCAIALSNQLISCFGRLLRRARFPIQMVAPAESVKPSATLFEECDYCVKIIEGPYSIARIIGAPRVGPAAITLFMA